GHPVLQGGVERLAPVQAQCLLEPEQRLSDDLVGAGSAARHFPFLLPDELGSEDLSDGQGSQRLSQPPLLMPDDGPVGLGVGMARSVLRIRASSGAAAVAVVVMIVPFN